MQRAGAFSTEESAAGNQQQNEMWEVTDMGCGSSKTGGAGGSDSKYSPSTVQRAGGSSTEDVQRLTGGDHATQGITDVSQLRFEEGLKGLSLYKNQIVDVSGLTLPEGLTELNLDNN